MGTRAVPTQEQLTIDGNTGNLGITNPTPLAKLHIKTSRTGPGDIDMITLSNRFELTETGTKEPTISFDNGQPTPIGWKLSASVINEDYFRIRKHDIGAERTHLLINQLGQTQLSSRITGGTQNRVLRLSNLFDGPNAPSVENQISIDNGQADPTGWLIGAGVAGPHHFRISSELAGQATEHMRILNNGNVGIGTTSPGTKLSVQGNLANNQGDAFLSLVSPATEAKGIVFGDEGQPNWAWRIEKPAGSQNLVIGDGTPTNSMTITPAGNFGIGVVPHASSKVLVQGNVWIQDVPNQNFSLRIGNWQPNQTSTHQDGKLYCSGKGVFQSLFVLSPNDWIQWPDFVFAKNYKLPSLKETEQFIEKEQHLPGVPSAKEVNEKGVDLLEMNRILLQKVEEMTLHLIRLEKEVESLKTQK